MCLGRDVEVSVGMFDRKRNKAGSVRIMINTDHGKPMVDRTQDPNNLLKQREPPYESRSMGEAAAVENIAKSRSKGKSGGKHLSL